MGKRKVIMVGKNKYGASSQKEWLGHELDFRTWISIISSGK
jgi:hypothetical protein